jgi:hypothetical protein
MTVGLWHQWLAWRRFAPLVSLTRTRLGTPQAEAVVHDFKPQEVSNLLWAYAKLGVKPPHMLLVALWEGVGIDAIHTASGASSSASSSGIGGYADSSSGGYYADSSSSSAASARLSAFKPAELSMLVWAMAVLKLAPGERECCGVSSGCVAQQQPHTQVAATSAGASLTHPLPPAARNPHNTRVGKAWWDQFLQSSFHKMTAQTPQVRCAVCSAGAAAHLLLAGVSCLSVCLVLATHTHTGYARLRRWHPLCATPSSQLNSRWPTSSGRCLSCSCSRRQPGCITGPLPRGQHWGA